MFARVLLLAGMVFQSTAMGAIHRDAWLANYQDYFLEAICSDSGPLSDLAQKTSPANCVAKVTAPLQNCIQTFEARMPAALDDASGSIWGRDLGRCTAENLTL